MLVAVAWRLLLPQFDSFCVGGARHQAVEMAWKVLNPMSLVDCQTAGLGLP